MPGRAGSIEDGTMCGIVGAVAERNVVPILMEGLRRLEYRGYDSAGIAVLNGSKHLTRLRTGTGPGLPSVPETDGKGRFSQ